ncbi:MAG TPA: ubiquinol-cytochrome C chaperone family protein [Hyphomonadaceae bacterium]|nr:ubiquinol-cytochrome C chaperone family protein [Hyphomonadaceae bacterium]HPI49888.1 ubiquinol-cytochrome C chaperone family protein [Hyphomonadaceae bacterium]
MALGSWFQSKKNRWAVERLHRSIQDQALKPEFYYDGGVRDNFSGRFEMTSLLAALMFRRLRAAGGAGKALAQDVFDALFDGFDEALRDIGTGDLTVGKKIRKMGEAFYGRAKAYDEALAGETEVDLQHSLVRNLGLADTEMERFGKYVRLVESTLRRHTDEQLMSGEVNWPRLP